MFNKYAWVVPLNDKGGINIVNAFQKIISKGWKPSKIWADQGGEFYHKFFKRFLKNNNIEMCWTCNEGKSDVVERFIKTLKIKLFKHMTAVSKNVCFNVLDDIVNKYYNTVHRTIKIKPVDVKSDFYAEYNEDFNEKDPKFKIGDYVRISKYKNIFAKGHIQNWSEEVFIISKIKNTVPWTYAISDLNDETIARSFYEKELQKTNQNEYRVEKVIKRKGDILYVKLKGFDSRFDS